MKLEMMLTHPRVSEIRGFSETLGTESIAGVLIPYLHSQVSSLTVIGNRKTWAVFWPSHSVHGDTIHDALVSAVLRLWEIEG
jgi:hypothetical protein